MANQVATTEAINTAAPTAGANHRGKGFLAARVYDPGVRMPVGIATPFPASEWAKSCAVAKRSAGSFASAMLDRLLDVLRHRVA